MIRINKEATNYSTMIGITVDRANEIYAIILVAAVHALREAEGKSSAYTDGMLYSDVLETALKHIDQSKPEEILYLGFKYADYIQMSAKKGMGYPIKIVTEVTRPTDSFEEAVKYVAPTLKTY